MGRRRSRPRRATVEDPRRRRRTCGRQPRQARLRRLGGRRGPAAAPRRVPARVRRAAGAPPTAGPPLRPLRRRLRALPHRLPPDRPRRRGALQGVRRGGGNPGRPVRRLDVGRARRRKGPLGAASPHVLPRRHRPVRPGEAALRSPRAAQPRRARRPGPRRAGPADGSRQPLPAGRDRRRVRRGGPPVLRRRQVPGEHDLLRRRDVPVVPGDPRREGLDARPRPRAAGDGQRLADQQGLALAGGARGARPVPVVQGLRPGLPHRHRHGRVQGARHARDVQGAAAPPQPLRAGLAAALGPPHHDRSRARQAGQPGRPHAGAG